MTDARAALDPALPRATDAAAFAADPFGFLGRARDAHGALVVLRDGGPVFSRDPACPGAVVAFGAAAYRAVLSDIETFAMPVSAARQLGLSPALANLTRGLHSMRGDEHARQRRIVAAILNDGLADHAAAARDAVASATARWRPGKTIRLLETMRGLLLALAGRVLFGADAGIAGALAATEAGAAPGLIERLDAFFVVRRELSSPGVHGGEPGRALLAALGEPLDAALRAYVRACRSGRPGEGLCGRLAASELAEDAVVAHANVLFVSATEPVAVALAWLVLVLSQLPGLRGELRDELAAGRAAARGSLVERVISECRRVLPPNAVMARVTSAPTELCGAALPAGTEIALCPLVAHRDPVRFPAPDRFDPARWLTARPSPFEYLPFGAGGHGCAGRALAGALIASVIAELIPRHDLVLAGDQAIDWRLHIQLQPRTDPVMRVRSPGARRRPTGVLRGTVTDLVRLGAA